MMLKEYGDSDDKIPHVTYLYIEYSPLSLHMKIMRSTPYAFIFKIYVKYANACQKKQIFPSIFIYQNT